MRTTAECWKEVLRTAMIEHGFRFAATTGVLRVDSGEVALEVRFVGSRFNLPIGHGVPPAYYLWARLIASPTPLPTSVAAYRTLVDYTFAGARQMGTYFTGPFERLAAAGFGPPDDARFDEDALRDLDALVGLLGRVPDAVSAGAWRSENGDLLDVNAVGQAGLVGVWGCGRYPFDSLNCPLERRSTRRQTSHHALLRHQGLMLPSASPNDGETKPPTAHQSGTLLRAPNIGGGLLNTLGTRPANRFCTSPNRAASARSPTHVFTHATHHCDRGPAATGPADRVGGPERRRASRVVFG